VIAVDLDAVAEGAGQAQTGQVMIVSPNNVLERRKVALGIETANHIEVRSGLNDGDKVVLSGRASLQPGQEVKPKITAMSANAL
jgi:hypothetical protein